MKKVLLTVFAAFTMFAASAQIEQGTILLSGSSGAGFISYDKDAGDFSEFGLDVKGGYFVIDNLTVGLNLGFYKNSEADDAALWVGPFARYYFNGKIFAGAGFTIEKEGDYSASRLPIEVGYAAFLNDVVAIEPSLSFTSRGGDMEGSEFGLNVGISVYLNRGK